jgi:RNA polymerase sigma factor (TIGR02999 family)
MKSRPIARIGGSFRPPFSTLRPEQKEVYLLRMNGCLTYEEIAKLRRTPAGTIKTQMRAAIAHLRQAPRARNGWRVLQEGKLGVYILESEIRLPTLGYSDKDNPHALLPCWLSLNLVISKGVILGLMSEVTRILSAIEQGDPHAAGQLLPLVYTELRQLAAQKLAQEKPGQTLEATALVHEAYLRLVDVEKVQNWDSRGHFFAAAAEAMRRILVERARQKKSLKAGGGRRRIQLAHIQWAIDQPGDDLLALNEALEKLEKKDKRKAELVKLRFFAGLTNEQAAKVLGISSSTADNDWAYARSWLRLEISGESASPPDKS